MVDNQNINARYYDKFGKGTTSVKLNAPPGGNSTFSLSWGNDDPSNNCKSKKNSYANNDNSFKKLGAKIQQPQHHESKTSVKVKQAPGGQSSIKLG